MKKWWPEVQGLWIFCTAGGNWFVTLLMIGCVIWAIVLWLQR